MKHQSQRWSLDKSTRLVIGGVYSSAVFYYSMSWKGPLDESITHEWREVQQKGGKLPAVRTGATSCLHDGSIYLFFGYGAGVGRSSDVWRFNIAEGLWSTVQTKGNNSDKPGKRDGHSTTDIGDGKVLIFGGQGDPSVNEKSERTLDIVKTKTWAVRDLYNDLFQYDCKSDTFAMLCPEGGVPLCRRGHSAMFFPKGGYSEHQLNIPHIAHHLHQHHASVSTTSSPKKKKGDVDEVIVTYDPIPENSIVVFGGSGMEVSKYIEAVYSDVWVYNLDSGRWNKTKCRGIEPKPLFDHRCVRVGHIMLVVGGITATNAKAPTLGNELTENHDVMILNLKTLVWSYVDIITADGKPTKLNLHGHSLVVDPHETGIVYLFGGKDTVDGKLASMETIQGAKKWLKKSHDCHAWAIDVQAGTMSPIPTVNTPPVSRYEHLTQVHASEGVSNERPPAPKRKAGFRDEPLFYLFGGARNDQQGLCEPTLHALTRRFTYTNPELMSIGGSKAPAVSQAGGSIADPADDNNTISTVHTADQSSIYTAQQDIPFEEGDDLRQPSIWEKRQKMDISSGKTTMMRTPSSWTDLKLALSSSFTEKRSSHLAPGSPTLNDSPKNSRPGTGLSTSSEIPTAGPESTAQPKHDGGSTGLTVKQKQKREMMRLKSLGSQVLPIVKGKAYKEAKQAYFTKFPAPMPPLRTYESSLSMTASNSMSKLLGASQSKMA